MDRSSLLTVITLASVLSSSFGGVTIQLNNDHPYLLHLVATTIPVAENCGDIIQEVYNRAIASPDVPLDVTIGLVNKKPPNSPRPDYQTDADTASQVHANDHLANCVKTFIGEETISDETRPRNILGAMRLQPVTKGNGKLNLDSFEPSKLIPEIPVHMKAFSKEDISLHADPLDATLEYVEGILAMLEYLKGVKILEEMIKNIATAEAISEQMKANEEHLQRAKDLLFSVTAIFGYASKEEGIAGVMCQPFYAWEGVKPIKRTVWGVDLAFWYGGFTIKKLPDVFTIAITRSNKEEISVLTAEIQKIIPEALILQIGGTVKGLLVAIGEIHATLDWSRNSKTWDTTGPVAITMSSGGRGTDMNGQSIRVPSEPSQKIDYYRNNGIILTAHGVEHEKLQMIAAAVIAAKAATASPSSKQGSDQHLAKQSAPKVKKSSRRSCFPSLWLEYH